MAPTPANRSGSTRLLELWRAETRRGQAGLRTTSLSATGALRKHVHCKATRQTRRGPRSLRAYQGEAPDVSSRCGVACDRGSAARHHRPQGEPQTSRGRREPASLSDGAPNIRRLQNGAPSPINAEDACSANRVRSLARRRTSLPGRHPTSQRASSPRPVTRRLRRM